MSKFIYNRFSNGSYESQYRSHLQNISYINSINQNQSSNANEIKEIISGASKDQIVAIKNSSKAICGEINKGFSMVADKLDESNFRLNEINEGINNLTSMLDYKTDLLIEQSQITNQFLAGISKQLLIPDSQKQRGYHIEKGLLFLKSALAESPNSEFFLESYEEFCKAREIESTDYFSLYRLGFIHFSSLKYLNLRLAEEFFALSAKYGKVLSLASSSSTHNIINARANEIGIEQGSGSINSEIIQALLMASYCAQLQNKIKMAICYAEEAYNRKFNVIKSGLVLAKLYGIDKNPQKSSEIVEELLNINPYHSLDIVNDIELMLLRSVTDKLTEISDMKCKEAKIEFAKCSKQIIEKSYASELYDTIKSKFENLNYLKSIEILEELNLARDWKLKSGEKFTLIQFLKWERAAKEARLLQIKENKERELKEKRQTILIWSTILLVIFLIILISNYNNEIYRYFFPKPYRPPVELTKGQTFSAPTDEKYQDPNSGSNLEGNNNDIVSSNEPIGTSVLLQNEADLNPTNQIESNKNEANPNEENYQQKTSENSKPILLYESESKTHSNDQIDFFKSIKQTLNINDVYIVINDKKTYRNDNSFVIDQASLSNVWLDFLFNVNIALETKNNSLLYWKCVVLEGIDLKEQFLFGSNTGGFGKLKSGFNSEKLKKGSYIIKFRILERYNSNSYIDFDLCSLIVE
jgi:hypothetical protein